MPFCALSFMTKRSQEDQFALFPAAFSALLKPSGKNEREKSSLNEFSRLLFNCPRCSFARMSRRFTTHWLPLLLWMSVIFSASTGLGSPAHTSLFVVPFLHWLNPDMSPETIERVHYCVRKTAHFVEYSMLGFLIWRVVHSAPAMATHHPSRHFRLALLFAALYAASDETHQIFVPSREAAVTDVLLDTCGAAAGLALTWCVVWWRTPK
jgi:VanZ family protein